MLQKGKSENKMEMKDINIHTLGKLQVRFKSWAVFFRQIYHSLLRGEHQREIENMLDLETAKINFFNNIRHCLWVICMESLIIQV